MKVAGIGGLIVIAIWIAVIYGWIANIVDIIHTVSDPITGMFILRCVGIIVAPVGAIMGYF